MAASGPPTHGALRRPQSRPYLISIWALPASLHRLVPATQSIASVTWEGTSEEAVPQRSRGVPLRDRHGGLLCGDRPRDRFGRALVGDRRLRGAFRSRPDLVLPPRGARAADG